MKQIKGEPWPPGETLAGYRDGIQMEDHEWGTQGVFGLFGSFGLFFAVSYRTA